MRDDKLPTDFDEQLTRNLETYLYQSNIIESTEVMIHRSTILKRLEDIVDDWSRQIGVSIVCSFFVIQICDYL